MTYRYTFYNIPYMRGGVDVPALAAGDVAEEKLEQYFIMEIFSSRQFSEEQVQIVLSEGESLASSKANYLRVAKTQNTAIKDYSTDTNVSFWWVDDVQLLGAVNAAGDLAARVTISPDVWLTDFFAAESSPTVTGRIEQTTIEIDDLEKTPPLQPIWDYGVPYSENILKEFPPPSNPDYEFCVVVFLSTNANDILGMISDPYSSTNPTLAITVAQISGASKLRIYPKNEENPSPAAEWNVSVIKMYVVPEIFVKNLRNTGASYRYEIESSPSGLKTDVESFSTYSGISSNQYNIVYQTQKPKYMFWDPLHYLYFGTPSRLIKVDTRADPDGGTGGNEKALMSIAVTSNSFGTESLTITLFINGEIIDISEDFEVDYAVNEAGVAQSQFKSLAALRGISSAVGAIGGFAGGIASGNYFGAVQSLISGASALGDLAKVKKQPAQVKNENGNVPNLLESLGPIYWVYSRSPLNIVAVTNAINSYGYIYEANPVISYESGAIPRDEYFRFAQVDVFGMTGGQNSAVEISEALLRGVRLKTL